jgi:DNA-binding Lrp family transcriptional regulator
MRGLDDTDREILRLLLEDGRRPYREIASAVDLSAPAVSDRVDRLQDLGLIRRFTVDIDRSLLREGRHVLIRIDCEPDTGARVQDAIEPIDAVDHVFRTADDTVVCTAFVADTEVGSFLGEAVPLEFVREYDVDLLADATLQPDVGEAELAIDCVECGNTVTAEGTQERIDGTLYHFCCASCRENFRETYEELREGA